jgi:hypothetical protein
MKLEDEATAQSFRRRRNSPAGVEAMTGIVVGVLSGV